MKVKKTVAVLVILVGFFVAIASELEAAPGWYNCTVDNVGMAYETLYINLKPTTTSPTLPVAELWVVANASYQKQLMAIALTAISNNQPVLVYIDPAVSLPTLWIMYLSK